jgi:hypothetical protein
MITPPTAEEIAELYREFHVSVLINSALKAATGSYQPRPLSPRAASTALKLLAIGDQERQQRGEK